MTATVRGVLSQLPAAEANRQERGNVTPDRAALVSRLFVLNDEDERAAA